MHTSEGLPPSALPPDAQDPGLTAYLQVDWETEIPKWEANQGPAQTAFFAEVTVACLPEPLIRLIRTRQLEILDWGCALGDALPVLARAFPTSRLSGLDLSPLMLARARARQPQWEFSTVPLRERPDKVPVVYVSNCLEHFEDPLRFLRQQILPQVQDYAIILVPYQEIVRCPGHLATIDASTFLPVVDDFGMLFWRVIPTGQLPGNHWNGQQLLLVYAHHQAAGLSELISGLRQWRPAASHGI